MLGIASFYRAFSAYNGFKSVFQSFTHYEGKKSVGIADFFRLETI